MSKPAGQRTHKADIEARRARGGYEAGHQVTHPQRDARQQAAAYRLANPLPEGSVEVTYPNGIFEPPILYVVNHNEPDRLAESYRTW